MSMEITNNYNNYATSYAAANSKKQVTEDKKAGTAGEAASTRDKVADYYSNLQKKYDCVKNGKVSISGSYLKECANDPEKAKQLESDLAFYKESYESGRKNAEANARSLGARLESYEETWSYDSKGNLTMMAQSTVVSGDPAKEAAEKKAAEEEKAKKKQEKKLAEEKTKERIEEKKKAEKAEQEKAAEKLQEEKPIEVLSKTKPDDFYRPGIDVSV